MNGDTESDASSSELSREEVQSSEQEVLGGAQDPALGGIFAEYMAGWSHSWDLTLLDS